MNRQSKTRRRRQGKKLRLETLESRLLLAADLGVDTNPVEAEDVNGDGDVTPVDVLMVVNAMRERPRDGGRVNGFLDVNSDGDVTPVDVLRVVNRLNRGDRNQAPDRGRSDRPEHPHNESDDETRSIDGSGNNVEEPQLGTPDSQLLRLTAARDHGAKRRDSAA